MDYIKIRFGKNLEHMHTRLQSTIDDMFRRVNPILMLQEQTWRPQMDVYETPEQIIVVGEISGVDKEDLEVEVDQKAVRITGVRRETARVPGMRYHLAEIVYGSFERVLFLPVPIDPEKVQASYTNGLLKVTMAKKARPGPRQISVQGE